MRSYKKNNTKLIVYTTVFFSICFCAESWSFSQPIVQKAQQAQQHLLIIGKAIAGLSVIGAVILFLLGKPQWKWFGYIILGGTLLTGIGPIIQWVTT